MKKLLLSTIIIANGCIGINAQTPTKDEQLTASQQLNPVTITGTGTFRRAANSPVSIQVITQKQINDAGVTSLADALTRLTSGVTTMTNGMGTFFNMNGVSDDYVLILENGRRISGDDRMSRINISKVKRIEILGASAGSLYGSDAMAGVINIITDETKKSLELQTFTQLASKQRFTQEINADANAGNMSSTTTYSHKEADNWQVADYDIVTASYKDIDGNNVTDEQKRPTGRPMSQGFHSDNFTQRLQWTFNNAWSAYIKGNYYNHLTNRPQNAMYTSKMTIKTDYSNPLNPVITRSYTTKQAYTYNIHHESYLFGGGARWNPKANIHVYADIYSDNSVSKYSYWATADNYAYEQPRKRTHYWNENLRGIFRINRFNKLSTGLEAIQETLSSESDNIDFKQTDSYNIFAQDEINIGTHLETVLGARYIYNGNFGSYFTPTVALFAHFGALKLRASYSSGFRTPTLSQLYATDQAKTNARYTLANSELKPEQSHFFNANVEYSGKWWSAGITAFANKVKDMINYRTLKQAEIDASPELTSLYNEGWTTIRQRSNIDKADIIGVTANMRFIMPYGVSLIAQWTWTDANSQTMTLDSNTQSYTTTKAPVDKSVKNVGAVTLAYDHSWGYYHLNAQLQGHAQSRRYSSTYGYCNGFAQWDFTTHHTISLTHCTLQPGLSIENIFNKRDTSAWNSNFFSVNPGRSIVLSLSMSFTPRKS